MDKDIHIRTIESSCDETAAAVVKNGREVLSNVISSQISLVKQTKKRCTAIILSAGSGSRMKSDVAKQYILLAGKPVIWYSLNAVEQSGIIDDCILVAGADDLSYVRKEIVEKYGFSKVDAVIAGGEERWESVSNALRVVAGEDVSATLTVPNTDGYVFIHDGARPFLTEDIIRRTYEAVQEHHACVAAMPAKDTVKIADEDDFAVDTPDRRTVWTVQTPQVFDTELIVKAYNRLCVLEQTMAEAGGGNAVCISGSAEGTPGSHKILVTDDAGVVELFTDCRVKMVEGSYRNIKITTPEDLQTAEGFCAGAERDAKR